MKILATILPAIIIIAALLMALIMVSYLLMKSWNEDDSDKKSIE